MSNWSFLEKRRLCEINCLSRVVYDTLVYNNKTCKQKKLREMSVNVQCLVKQYLELIRM